MSDHDTLTATANHSVPVHAGTTSATDAWRDSDAVAERGRRNGTASSALATMSWSEIARLVWADAQGTARQQDIAALETDPVRRERVLLDLLDQTEDSLAAARRLPRPIRRQVVRDFEVDFAELAAVYERLTGGDATASVDEPEADAGPDVAATGNARTGTASTAKTAADDRGESKVLPEAVALQLSWLPGRIVAWAGGAGAEPESAERVMDRLAAVGAPDGVWCARPNLELPGGVHAESLVAEVGDVLGWLVGLDGPSASRACRDRRADGDDADLDPSDDLLLGASAMWLRTAARTAVELVAGGRIVPRLHRVRKRRNRKRPDTAEFSVQWQPASLEAARLEELVGCLPGAVAAADPKAEPSATVQSVLAGTVDAIVTSAARRLDVPAASPEPRSRAEMAEAFLAYLDGTRFVGSAAQGADLARRIELWARSVTAAARQSLVVRLDEPDDAGAWHMEVLATSPEGVNEPVEVAMVSGVSAHRTEVRDQLTRLERLLPVLMRPGGKRRGEVVLSQDEAWQLMSVTGPALQSAGFTVEVPNLSRERPAPSLRLTATDGAPASLGAQQLTAVSWTAAFGDVELTADQIHELASQARPLVRDRGRWIALDHADLAEAAAALAERAGVTALSGSQMLRQALGLEGPSVRGGITIAGSGWAADLLRSAAAISSTPRTSPHGFVGTLRSYQAEALAWLEFLDGAGLGGCLALDMGLGKTPTVLARIAADLRQAPALVIAPPAVVSNWAAEAARFTPGLSVIVHHGPARRDAAELVRILRDGADRDGAVRARADTALTGRIDTGQIDVVITTYGTAVRDIDALEDIAWDRIVVDEAQVIKNHTSETAKQLRRLSARIRLALTGTPIENGLGDLWAIMDFCNPDLVGSRASFIAQLQQLGDARGAAESALHALNGVLVFRRTKAESQIAAELPDRIDELAHCAMTPEQIGLYQAVLDQLVADTAESEQAGNQRKGVVLAAITALKQICNHPLNYRPDDFDTRIEGRSGKLARLHEILDVVFAAGERALIFTHFATWGERLADHLTQRTGLQIDCYHGGLGRSARDRLVQRFQAEDGPGAIVLSLKAGGTGLNLTAASHVVLYDRWWNPAVEDQARDRAWRIGQERTVICHRLVCPGTVDERVEEVVSGKRRIADMILPKSSSIGDLDADQLRRALGIDTDALLADELDWIENGSPYSDGPSGERLPVTAGSS
ncbi:DEAD/DEAH box helicase [Candidatus Poriferisodalis sp.]|uniref:DEAD/DEAH box helicase n=1 Tax=Candidatus Poriferisodalis sp. TaxID=3101277 RepID=UPI003B02E289